MKDILNEVIGAFISTLVMGMLAYVLGFLNITEFKQLTIPVVVGLVTFFVLIRSMRRYGWNILRRLILTGVRLELINPHNNGGHTAFKQTLTEMLGNPNGTRSSNITGIIGWYTNQEDFRPRLSQLIKEAKSSVKILTYIAESDLSKGTAFYDAIKSNPHKCEIRVLLAARDSRYVSESQAIKIGKPGQAPIWQRRIEHVENTLNYLRIKENMNIIIRNHDLPFVWRLWFIDDEKLFVTAFLFNKSADNKRVPGFEINRSTEGQMHLFDMFLRYFEQEWLRADKLTEEKTTKKFDA